jgi:hypothetical protein
MDITDKIQAILNKARATDNEHEAEVFQQKAFELMLKHNVTEDQLHAGTTEHDPMIRQEMFVPGRYPKQKQIVAHAICDSFGVFVLSAGGRNVAGSRTDYRIFIYGRKSHMMQFATMVNELWWYGEMKYNQSPERRGNGFMASYWQAYASTLKRRLRETMKRVEDEDNVSLVPAVIARSSVARRTAQEMEGGFGRGSASRTGNSAGAAAGRDAGNSATLARGSVASGGQKGLNR